MEDLHKIGGVPALLKYLLKHTDLIDGNQLTVTGKTISQNLEDVAEIEFENQNIVRRLDNPIKPIGHLTILRGSLCPGSAVAKLTGAEGARFEVRTSIYTGLGVSKSTLLSYLTFIYVSRELQSVLIGEPVKLWVSKKETRSDLNNAVSMDFIQPLQQER